MVNGKKQILLIDGMNIIHRARSGFTAGEHAVTFNFFRQLRSMLEMFPSDRVIFVTEGTPKHRLDIDKGYKANRDIDKTDVDAVQASQKFFEQANVIIDTLAKHFPVSVVRHVDYECDDVIYTIVKHGPTSADYTVISTDSDFTQMLNEFSNVRLYNPVKKTFVEAPQHDYVTWKALRGDPTDNVNGLPGIGDKRAEKLISDIDELKKFLTEDADKAKQFIRNMQLIKLAEITDKDEAGWMSSRPIKDWNAVKTLFNDWRFASMLKDKYWDRFIATFDPLFGP